MQYTYLGRTGMKVSRLCLGTMNFGMNTDEKEAFRIMDMALDAGINFFDTANMYGSLGDKGRAGWTEEIIGRWFRQGGGRREKVVLATKVFADMHDPDDGPNGGEGLSAYKIRRHLEASLKRLGTEHVEICYMHGYEPHAPWEELFSAFHNFARQGKVDYLGCDNFAARQICSAQEYARKTNQLGIVVSEHRYNLLSRLPEIELNPVCKEQGIGIVVWSPLQMGLLSGSYKKELTPDQRSKKFYGKIEESKLEQLKEFTALCNEIGEKEAIVATAWILQREGITAVNIGPRTVSHMDLLQAAELKPCQEILRKLDEIFPGYGEAPFIYSIL